MDISELELRIEKRLRVILRAFKELSKMLRLEFYLLTYYFSDGYFFIYNNECKIYRLNVKNINVFKKK